jgi:serine/threonine-protein kinase
MNTGDKLGSFTIEKQLGEGAMGVVYKAIHDKTGKVAAIKVISSEVAIKGNAGERFQRESEILQQFKHPNIVRCLAVGRSKGKDYFAMEFIPGKTLDDMLQEREFLPWREVVELSIQLCDALHYAHQKGVVHRDLKPSNLMITEDGRLKLTDFGIAKDLDATALTGTGRTLGTAAYMAPEQIRGTPAVSHKTDLYSLGIVMYQMLTGNCPFQGKSAMILMHCHLTEPAPRASEKVPDLPRPLDDLIHQLLAKDPTDRPWDADAVAHKLREILDKAAKGKLAKVFPIPENPSRAGMIPTEPATSVATASGSKTTASGKRKAQRAGDRGLTDDDQSPSNWVGTATLSLALLALLAFTGYMLFWPYSEKQLLERAGALMASADSLDWKRARDDYFDEIAERFPQHRDQVAQWRERIDLEQLRRRANVLERPNLLASSQPSNPAESQYVAAFTSATAAIKDGDLPGAESIWRDLAELSNVEEEETARLWAKIALEKAQAIASQIQNDRVTADGMLARADAAELEGKLAQAIVIRRQVLERFGKARHLQDRLEAARAGLPAPPAPSEPSGNQP